MRVLVNNRKAYTKLPVITYISTNTDQEEISVSHLYFLKTLIISLELFRLIETVCFPYDKIVKFVCIDSNSFESTFLKLNLLTQISI